MTLKPASLLALAVALGCGTSTTPTATRSAPAPAPPPGVTPISAEESARHRSATLVNDNQETNDRIAKQVAEAIAGHEKEPAEQVFKNIQSLKGMPAERLVRVMNMGYSRALGVSCMHCHVEADFSSDEKRPKRAAREMMAMNKAINEQLRGLKNLEGKPEEKFVNCSTCHRGQVDPNAGIH
jgi:photosynthetic reaction center cytochrome c subunit